MNWVQRMWECNKSAYHHFFPLIFLFCYFKPRASLSEPWCFCRSFSWLFSTWFECVSMMVILLNCVTLGMYQPCEDMDCLSDRCKILQVSRLPSCCDGASVQVTNFHACFPSACGLAGLSLAGSSPVKWQELALRRAKGQQREWMNFSCGYAIMNTCSSSWTCTKAGVSWPRHLQDTQVMVKPGRNN